VSLLTILGLSILIGVITILTDVREYKMHRDLPIGIFDSGIGGLTVYKELRQLLPKENIIYFGDTARAPYGSRTKEEICDFVDEIMQLMSLCSIKVGVVACNTITVLGTAMLSKNYNFELIGNNTGAVPALRDSKSKRIGVIATETTIASGKHRADILALDSRAVVFPRACPLFAQLIEAGSLEGDELRQAAYHYLTPLKEANIDTLILACTHYPYITLLLQEVMGEEVVIIDPAVETARQVQDYLAENNGLKINGEGSSHLYFSNRPEQVRDITGKFFDTTKCEFRLLDITPLARYYANNLSANASYLG
jgi:glutamate racemase